MNAAIRILCSVLVLTTGASSIGPDDAQEAFGIAVGPHNVHGADTAALAMIEDAHDAYASVGLELPGVEIHVLGNLVDCGGYQGRFIVDGADVRVEICSRHPFTVLHEFAHVWTHYNLFADTRSEFLELHGANSWNSSSDDWSERGTELAAETIGKGLLDRPLPEWQLDSIGLLDHGFRLLTGVSSPRFATALGNFEFCKASKPPSTVGSSQR